MNKFEKFEIIIKKSKFEAKVIVKLKELARDDPKKTIRDLEVELNNSFPGKATPKKSTINDILNRSGFKIIKALRKTIIYPRNIIKRVEFCDQMANFGDAFWNNVIWSDETSVQQCPKGKELILRVHSTNKNTLDMINPQIHSGGFSVMFWGCFSKLGLGPLVAIEGTMNSEKYIEILSDYVLPEIQAAGQHMVFMQDNAPCHKSRVVKQFMDEKNIETLDWPPQSPDLNPIENLWAIIKARRQKKFGMPRSRKDLIEQIFFIWDDIEPEIVSKLADSANKRIKECLKAKGKITKY
jgi:transposase